MAWGIRRRKAAAPIAPQPPAAPPPPHDCDAPQYDPDETGGPSDWTCGVCHRRWIFRRYLGGPSSWDRLRAEDLYG